MRSLLRASILFFALFASVSGLFGQSIRVLVVTGDVTLQAPGDAAPRPAVKGDIVPAGSRLVTGPGARVVLTPFPGIKSMLAENSTLVVERAQSAAQAGTATLQQATLDLKTGVLVSDLEKQEGIAYDYSVKTPRGVAGARGTIYSVAIDVNGVESVLVSDGSIQITLTDGTSLALAPGQASLARPGAEPAAVSKLSDLLPADQAILQLVMEATLDNIAAAIEAGVDLQPDALQLTLQFAQDFGFTIDPALLESLQAALAVEDVEEFGVMFDVIDSIPTDTQTHDDNEVVNENTPSEEPPEEEEPIDTRTPEERFADDLSPSRRAAFLARPSDIRAKLLQLNDPDYTARALDPSPVSGLTQTNAELRDELANLAYLKFHDPAAFAFLKQVSGGPGLPLADSAPSPSEHSLDAFRRTANSWTALSPAQRTTLVSLGAGESIMDTSATYLGSLLDVIADLPAAESTALAQTGWGDHLVTIAGDHSLQHSVQAASTYTAQQRATIKAFDFSPYPFISQYIPTYTGGGDYSTPDLPGRLDALADLSSADQAALRRLDLQDRLLSTYLPEYYDPALHDGYGGYVTPDFGERLQLTLDFYHALSAEQKDLIVALDAGHWLFQHALAQTISTDGGSIPVLSLVQNILDQVADLGAEQREAAFAVGLFSGASLGDHLIHDGGFVAALDAYLAAPASVQRFIRDEFDGSDLRAVTIGTNSEYQARPLSEIITILEGLDSTELDTLRDMEIGNTLTQAEFFPSDYENEGEGENGPLLNALSFTFEESDGLLTPPETPFETPASQLKAMIGFYSDLDDTRKFTLRELGILGATKDNFAAFLADFEGLDSLLGAYAALPGETRAVTQRIADSAYYQNFVGRSFFVPRASPHDRGNQLYYVSFTSDDDLHVGATRFLRITSGSSSEFDTFTTGEGKNLYLRAADLIELNDVRFANSIRSITMEAVTLNLYNIDFRDGSTIALNSKLGGVSADGSGSGAYPTFNQGNVYGRVNFNNVSYGGHALDSAPSYDTYGINIRIGTLENKAVPPDYIPLPVVSADAPIDAAGDLK